MNCENAFDLYGRKSDASGDMFISSKLTAWLPCAAVDCLAGLGHVMLLSSISNSCFSSSFNKLCISTCGIMVLCGGME